MAGRLLGRVNELFSNIIATDVNSERQEIKRKISKTLFCHWGEIFSNAELFKSLE